MSTLSFRIQDRYHPGTPIALIVRDLRALGFQLSNNVRGFGLAVRRRNNNTPPFAA